jgi:hypothetical protein
MSDIYQKWIQAKADEKAATVLRRALEDEMVESFKVPPDLEGVGNYADDGFAVKITGRMNRKIDADQLREIAAENGLTAHLSNLFSWKPSINAKAWKAATDDITKVLIAAITTAPGRPSFQITKKED